MAKKKLSTQDILAAARKQARGSDAGSTEPDGAKGGAGETASPPPAGHPSKSAGTPKSTSDIPAAARAQAETGPAAGAGSAESESETKKPAAKSAAKGGAAPKSTKDVLAAARAQAAGAAGTTKPDKPSARPKQKTSPKAPAAAAGEPAGGRPSVQEMLRAVRERETAPGAAAPKAAGPPPLPRKRPAGGVETTRRNVVWALVATPFALAWTLFTVTSGVAGLALARFMMPNVLVEPPTVFKVGPPTDYPEGSVSTKWKSEYAVWIVHNMYRGKEVIYALSTVCTHLGCTPNWLEGEQKFKCPCHGSGFYITGVNFEGPAPRPLERYAVRIAPDGMLEVDKSAKFQEELGQWEDPASFVEVA